MAAEKIGIGLIGAGLIGAFHSISLRAAIDRLGLPVELAHVADVDEGRASHYQSTFGFRRASGDPEALLEDKNVDAVFICTWTSEHLRLVKAAAARKKHVFCEKPLAFSAQEAGAMQEAVASAGVINQVGLVLRQGPIWNVLRHELISGDHGFPITVLFRDDQCFPIKGAHPSAWRKDPDKAGRGTILEHSIHDLDLLEWIFGTISSVAAQTACRFGHDPIEDLARVDLQFASGMSGVLVSVWHDVLNRHSNRRLEVFYEKTFLALESEFTGPFQVMKGKGGLVTIPEREVNQRFFTLRGIEDPAEQELVKMFGAYEDYLFCRAVLEGRAAAPDFQVAVRAHQLVDACYRSAREDERIATAPA